MGRRADAIVLFLTAMTGAALVASAAAALDAGQYEVSVHLDLPHIDGAAAVTTALICVTAGQDDTHGLKVLSTNNPLGRCAASNIREDGGTLLFDIICPGTNAATGAARYTLRMQGFDGVIAMKMGGKNMTMTERQSGRRTGSCRPPA